MRADLLGYCLTDRTGRYVWCGPGLKRPPPQLDRLPLWPDKPSALRAARALRAALNLELVPQPVRLR